MELPDIDGVDELLAAWPHEGDAADRVRALKYSRDTAQVTAIADALSAAVVRSAPRIDVVTWVPCSRRRRLERGFDPSELLARALARRLRLRARRSLRRNDDMPQTARDLQGRLAGPDLRAVTRATPARVLLVDDVCTTGSSLRSAAAALRSNGATAVIAAVATVAQPGTASPADATSTMTTTRSDGG